MKIKKMKLPIFLFCSFICLLTSCKKENSEELKLYSFSFENDTCAVTGLKSEEEDLALEIPSKIYKDNKTYTVTSINTLAFANVTNVCSIIIPDTVTSIESQAFARCTNLKKIKLSDNLKKIDSYAFDECTSLINVTLPDSLDTLSMGAFRKCSSLTSINIPQSITEIKAETFKSDSKLNYISAKTLDKIGNNAFLNCTSLSKIYLEEENKNIQIEDNNSYFKQSDIVISKDLNSEDICDTFNFVFDFKNQTCSLAGYKDISSTNSTVSIPSEVTFNSVKYSVTSIYDYAFFKENIKKCTIRDNITKINRYAFAYSTVEEIDTNKVVQIEQYAFSNCLNLKNITLNDCVVSIGDYAFNDCMSLKRVDLPLGLTKINSYLFSGCSKLTTVTICENVKKISSYAFANCAELRTIYYTSTKADFEAIDTDNTVTEEIKDVSMIYLYKGVSED